MRLGFDLDNVLANLIDPLNDYINGKFDLEFTRETWTSRLVSELDLTHEICNRKDAKEIELDVLEERRQEIIDDVVRVVYDIDFLSTLGPRQGAKGVIEFLRKKGHEIYVITSRKREAFDMSSKWLKDHGIYFDALVCTKFKARMAWNYGVRTFVDDDYDVLLDFANFRQAKFFKKLIVMSYAYNEGRYDKRIERASALHEVLAKLEIKGRGECNL
jgi:hypothetical protein